MRPYARVSDDKGGRSRSTLEQLGDLAADATERDWTLGDPYADDGISASKYGKKTRGDFQRLVDDLANGRFGAEILGLWEISRASRVTLVWAQLMTACLAAGVKIWSHADQRLFDLSVPGDWKNLINEAANAEFESSRTSQRVRRTVAQEIARGKPHGQAPTGYRRVYGLREGRERQYLRTEVVPEEAAWIVRLYEGIAEGRTLRSLAAEFEQEGIRSREGRVLSTQVLRGTATRITYSGRRRLGDEVRPADWPVIVPVSLWATVNRILSDPQRRVSRDGQARWLCSGIVTCARCQGPIRSGRGESDEKPSYRCRQADHVQVSREWLDRYAEAAILGYLGREDVAAALAAPDPDDPRVKKLENELASVREQLDDLERRLIARKITAEFASRVEKAWREEAANLEDQLRALAVSPALAAMVAPGQQVADRWQAAEMSSKRAVARLVLSPGLLGELRVGRMPDSHWCAECGKQLCLHQIGRRVTWHRA